MRCDHNLMRAALWYARHGWPIVPVNSIAKKPALKSTREKDGLTWIDKATTDPAQVREWWLGRYAGCGIAGTFGGKTGIIVIDVDNHVDKATGEVIDGESVLAALERKHGTLPDTVQQRTGGGGRQLFYRVSPLVDIRSKTGRSKPSRYSQSQTWWPRGVDLRASGGSATLPPSPHKSGTPYVWIRDPARHEIADLPFSWVELFRHREPPRIMMPVPNLDGLERISQRSIEGVCKRISSEKTGNRNALLFWGAVTLAEKAVIGALHWSDAESQLVAAASQAGLDIIEARMTIASGRNRIMRAS